MISDYESDTYLRTHEPQTIGTRYNLTIMSDTYLRTHEPQTPTLEET